MIDHAFKFLIAQTDMPTHGTFNIVDLPAPEDAGALEALRRKLRFRAWHRGTSEADLLIGTFADRHLSEFGAEALHEFRRLLEEDDPLIDDWIMGRETVPKQHDNNVMSLLRRFCADASALTAQGRASRNAWWATP